jgi:DNA-binding NarL/FixJ family response regulator
MLGAAPDVAVVGEATTGAEAIDLADRARPNVVLMDLRMPDVDGVAATAKIRERYPDVHILVLTTYDTDGDILKAIEAGPRATCSKTPPVRSSFAPSGRPPPAPRSSLPPSRPA